MVISWTNTDETMTVLVYTLPGTIVKFWTRFQIFEKVGWTFGQHWHDKTLDLADQIRRGPHQVRLLPPWTHSTGIEADGYWWNALDER